MVHEINGALSGPLTTPFGWQGQSLINKNLGAIDESKRGEFHRELG
jgi:hypothetical protein